MRRAKFLRGEEARIGRVVSALVMGGALLSCSTIRTAEVRGNETVTTSTFVPVPAARAHSGSGAVLLAFAVIGSQEKQVCRWRLINRETKKSHFVNVDLSSSYALGSLEPGTYDAGRFGCGFGRVWDLADLFKNGFMVESGKVSYMGQVVFGFKGRELETIRHASRSESAEAFIEAENHVDLPFALAISGFTGKAISRQMVVFGDSRDGFDVFAKGVSNPSVTLEPLVSQLVSCARDEGRNDPLRFGRMEMTALYRDGRFNEMKERKESNGLSDRLRSCVERGIMAFHPQSKSEVEVRVRY